MTFGPLDRVRYALRVVLIATGLCIGMFQLCGFLGFRFNTSPSLPMGLYIVTQQSAANLIEFCPAEPFASLAIVRGYRSPGVCRDGGAPLLKPIVASADDVVELSAAGIAVDGVLLPKTAPLSKDSKGRPLISWPFGRYPVPTGTIWVASTYHSHSFDSRYFGPVPTTAIRHRLKAFFTL